MEKKSMILRTLKRITDFVKLNKKSHNQTKAFPPLNHYILLFLNIWTERKAAFSRPLRTWLCGLQWGPCLCLIWSPSYHSRLLFLELPLTVGVNSFPTLNFSFWNGASQARLAIIDESQRKHHSELILNLKLLWCFLGICLVPRASSSRWGQGHTS